MAWTQTQVSLLNSAGTPVQFVAYTDGLGNYAFAHPILDNTGAIVAPANVANQAATNTKLDTGNAALAAIQSNSNPVQGIVAISSLDVDVTPGNRFAALCTVAGNVSVTLTDNTSWVFPLVAGSVNVFPFKVKRVNTAGTTATATYQNWQ